MNPLSGRSLSVVRPEIESVLDSATGIEQPVSQVLGHDYERLMQLRLEVKSAIHEGMPRYLCSECFIPVYICRRKGGDLVFRAEQVGLMCGLTRIASINTACAPSAGKSRGYARPE